MRFDTSLKRLQKAVKHLEKASKKKAKSNKDILAGQIDLFAAPSSKAASNNNDVDVLALKNQLDAAIYSVETLLKESA